MGEGDTTAERDALLKKNRSILDMIGERTGSLRKDLGPGDQRALSDYLDTVRELERRVNMASQRDLRGVDVPDAPVGELEDFDKQLTMMFDLIALAYQADLTRVATFVMAAEGTDRPYKNLNVAGGFHPTSHHANQRERIAELSRIQKYHVDRFAGFLKKLAATKEGDGSDPRPLAVPVWLEHEQQQPARQLSVAGGADRRRERQARRRQEPRAAGAHAARQRAPDRPRQARHPAAELRQQHRSAVGRVSMTNDRRSFLKTSLGGLAGLTAVPLIGSLSGCAQTPASPKGETAKTLPATNLPVTKVTERVSIVTGAPGNVIALNAGDGLVLVDAGSLALAPSVPQVARRRARAHAVQHALPRRSDGRKRALRQGGRADPRAHDHEAVARGGLLRAGGRPLGEGAAQGSRADRDVPRRGATSRPAASASSSAICSRRTRAAMPRCSSATRTCWRWATSLRPKRDPIFDWFAGGWLGGRTDAMDDLLELVDDQTLIVPAYGPVMSRASCRPSAT